MITTSTLTRRAGSTDALTTARQRELEEKQRELELFGGNALGRWILDNSALTGRARLAALILAHEYSIADTAGNFTVLLEQSRPELAEFVGCSLNTIRSANQAMVASGEWDVISGIGVTLTAYRPTERVINAILANKKGE